MTWQENAALIRPGDQFGKLVVLVPDAAAEGRFVCQCACGNQASVHGYTLTAGFSISCGCAPCNLCKSKDAENHVCRHTRRLTM